VRFLAFVPGVGLEPTRPQWSQDFKSCVSTDSTIRAKHSDKKKPDNQSGFLELERETRLELATLTLARLCSTN
jgi:hypothetical protein